MDRTQKNVLYGFVGVLGLLGSALAIHLTARVIRLVVVDPPGPIPSGKAALDWISSVLDTFFGYDFSAPTTLAEHQASVVAFAVALTIGLLIAFSIRREVRMKKKLA